jgi:sec-independent protein translocase protein TatC
MLAIPMWLLFELGLFLAKILIKEEPSPTLISTDKE